MKNEPHELVASQIEPVKSPAAGRNFVWLTGVLVLAFCVPLYELARFAAESELYSYILLIPLVSGYLAWLQRGQLPAISRPARLPAILLFGGGLVVLAGYALARHARFDFLESDVLAVQMAAFVLLFAGGCCWTLGKARAWALAFPITFLVFLAPLPTFLLNGTEAFLQHGSALAAGGFFQLAGATFFREGLVFKLPTITLQVAPECSGIHSSLVLLIVSLVAGRLFLRSPWKRTVLALAIIPLALLRNGFRVFVIGELCTHVGPEMINSPIHHRGGPLFFALSLIPFFLLLFYLRKSERFHKKSKPQ